MQILKQNISLEASESEFEMNVINVYPEFKQQTILGFGGAFTEAAAYNYAQMDEKLKARFMETYFGRSGAHYTIGRIPMGSCDFALAPYSEAEKEDLSDFNIEQDKKYILPMIKDAQKIAGESLRFFASPWSPPAFMKDTKELNHGGRLEPAFYQTYANLFVKFIKAYAEQGVKISAVTVQNEPNATQRWESCRFTGKEEATFAVNFLRPTLDREGLSDVKIILWDHNKERLADRAKESFSVKGAEEAVWGLGYHWYSGDHFDALDLVGRYYPEKPLLATEFCHEMIGSFNEEKRNNAYANEYIQSLRHGAVGLCDWNLLLNPTGGPFHWRKTPQSGCAAAFYYDAEKKELIEDGIFASIRSITSEVDCGDTVVATTCAKQNLPMVAVKKKNGSVVLFVLNTEEKEYQFSVRMGEKGGKLTVAEKSLCTFFLS